MRFSIVIPAYNYGHLVERAVVSACSQVGDDYEVIVIDDGSKDDTFEVCSSLIKKYKHLSVIQQDNAGASAARNAGVARARGEFILFLDADDELLPSALEVFRRAVLENQAIDVVVALTISVFPDGRERCADVQHISQDSEERLLQYLYKDLRLSNGAVLMRRGLLQRFSFNPVLRQTEDIPVFAHCIAAGNCLAVDFPVVRIYKHDGSRRHGSDAALSVGMALVDEVFDPSRLAINLMRHKEGYRARRALSLFRLLYRSGRYSDARKYFAVAFKSDWRQALAKPENLAKYLRAVISG